MLQVFQASEWLRHLPERRCEQVQCWHPSVKKKTTLMEKMWNGYIVYFRRADIITKRRCDSVAWRWHGAAESCNNTFHCSADWAAWWCCAYYGDANYGNDTSFNLHFFIDDMLEVFGESSFRSGFADDLAITCISRKKAEAEAMMQREVSKLEQWNIKNGLQLNTGKYTNYIFSTDSSES